MFQDTVHHYAQEIVTRWRKSKDEEVDVTENIMVSSIIVIRADREWIILSIPRYLSNE